MHLIILPKCHILLLMKIFFFKLLDTDANYIWCFVYMKENKNSTLFDYGL